MGVASKPSVRSSKNFGFLANHDQMLVALGTAAERYFVSDPVVCLIKCRQLGEALAQQAAAHVGLYTSREEGQSELLDKLEQRRVLNRQVARIFHDVRRAGNIAVHQSRGDHRAALHVLKLTRGAAIWFHQSFGSDPKFRAGAFVPPQEPEDSATALHEEIAALQKQVEETRSAREAAEAAAEEEALRRLSIEERLQQEARERAALEELLEESAQQELARIETIQQEAVQATAEQIEARVERAAEAADHVELDEAATRRIIDEQLRAAGWEADTVELSYSKGVRPQKNRNLAIAEWPTENGPADYMLFLGMQAVAVVEAKKKTRDVSASIEQAKRYSRGYAPKAGDSPPGGPWGEYKVPFLFATNGRPYLRQLETKSGVWFLDARKATNLSHALNGWYSPEGLKQLLRQDVEDAHERLKTEPTEYLGLRDYQLDAVDAVEKALEQGKREMLLAMATGTGKTRTCIGLCYRLLKSRRFRRILFLVDRTALGIQATNAFKDARLENLQTFTDIFDLKELDEVTPESDTKLQVATVQGMVKRVLFPDDEEPPPVDRYDCIVVDECHRGYLLDRELSDQELTFRSEADYISKYRRVLEHFDAVKIGLTATPALHTTEIFGRPVYEYTYREAVVDGYLCDHEPPIRIITNLAADGITWQVGEEIETYTPSTGEVQLSLLDDEVSVDIEKFNKQVVTENFNKAICCLLAERIDPRLDEKTLIFCTTDNHADMVVKLMKQAFQEQYGAVEDDAVVKITGSADKPLQLIRRYRNERMPSVAVTVDLLTTGIDIPKICNLVFIRRVKSRILYHQMLGRATRLCEEIDKEVFRVYDAVDLYSALAPYSDMKPVVPNPKVPFAQLVDELSTVKSVEDRSLVLGQLVSKLDRKKRRLKGAALEQFEAASEMSPDELLKFLREHGSEAASEWFAEHPSLATILDKVIPADRPVLISHHEDEVREVKHGFGDSNPPGDYLDGFRKFIEENKNNIPALLVVTRRPRDLTRKELKALKLALDEAGYSETSLRTAWRAQTNQDIVASVIGHVRQAALGDPLIPYEERVEHGMKKILASRRWTRPQRKWLDRIGKQLIQETVVDREALDRGQFKTQAGGFDRLNKVFGGKLEQLLGDISEAIWEKTG